MGNDELVFGLVLEENFYLTLEFIQSEGKYDGNTVNRRKSVKKSAMQLGNPQGKFWRKNPRDGYGPQSLPSLQQGNIYHTPAQQLLRKHGFPGREPGLSASR